MALHQQLQPRVLLKLTDKELATHFQNLVKTHHDIDSVNSVLLDFVHKEALPSFIYGIWLPFALHSSPHLLPKALRDQISWGVRKSAIQAVARIFHKRNWKDAWDNVLGSAAGLKEIIENLSLEEIRRLSVAIAMCRGRPDLDDAAATRIEELFQLLDEAGDMKSSTKRTVSKQLGLLSDLCSEPFLIKYWLSASMDSTAARRRLRHLARLRPHLFRSIAVGSVEFPLDRQATIIVECMKELIQAKEEYIPLYLPADVSSEVPSGIAFCLDIIHIISADSALREKVEQAVPDYIHETLKVAERRSCPFDQILAFFRHTLPLYEECFQYWEIIGGELTREILRCWSVALVGTASPTATFIMKRLLRHRDETRPSAAHREALESLLVQAIRLQVPVELDGDRWQLFTSVQNILEQIAPEVRLAFIKMLCRHWETLDIDLNAWPPSERESRLLPIWNLDILRLLPPLDAKLLFNRSLAIHDCSEFLPPGIPEWDPHFWREQYALMAGWDAHDPNNKNQLSTTRNAPDEMKLRAEREREPKDRLTWVKIAVQVANASTSLDIFHRVVEWTMRYLRDWHVFPDLLQHSLFTTDYASILTCVDFPPANKPQSTEALGSSVQKANQVLETYLDIIRLIVKEPYYKMQLTANVPSLFCQIITERIRGLEVYRKAGFASESELIDVLLKPLEPIVLEYELVANRADPTNLEWKGEDGLLEDLQCPPRLSPYILAFFDQLAKKRDEAWSRERFNNDISITDTSKCWPQGLPIQYLLPSRQWMSLALETPEAAPFVATKAQEILFAPADVALAVVPPYPHNDLHHSLAFVIRSHIQRSPRKEKQSRILSIWKHYAEIMGPYPNQLAVFRDWFKGLADGVRFDAASQVPPATMTYFDQYLGLDEVVEWDPLDGVNKVKDASQSDQKAHIPSILLHHRMQAEKHTFVKYEYHPKEPKERETANILWIWPPDFASSSTLPPQTCEAVSLSAVLLLDTLVSGRGRILSKPFPRDEKCLRYPSIYLDDQFVARMGIRRTFAIQRATRILERSVTRVPAEILYNLVISFLDSLSRSSDREPDYATLLKCTFKLIKLIPLTDRPDLAVNVVLRALKSLPNESSYHRHIRMNSLGKKLLPLEAERMVLRFAEFVCDALNKQREKPEGQEKSNDAPYVKITTIKMLAQLLANADYVPKLTCVNILRTLFHSSRHIDVRTEVVTAILEILNREGDKQDIYQLLTSLAFVSAGPSEREETTETDWVEAEKGARQLPEVSNDSERPILNLFITAAYSKVPEHYRADYVQRVVLPLLDESTIQHNRWMKCFLGQVDLTPEQAAVTDFGPFHCTIVDDVLDSWKCYLPGDYLLRHRTWAMSYLDCWRLDKVNEKLSAQNSGWRETKAGKHWLEYLEKHRDCDTFKLLKGILTIGITTRVENGLTITDVVEEYIHRAAIAARHPISYDRTEGKYTVSLSEIRQSFYDFRHAQHRGLTLEGKQSVYERLREMMERIIADIESLRTEEWFRSPGRQPIILPPQLELQTFLLASPIFNPMSSYPIEELATQVMPLVKSCAENPMRLVELDYIKKLSTHIPNQDLASYVLILGNGPKEEHNSLYGFLKIQIAQHALSSIKLEDQKLNPNLEMMVRRWKTSANELVRQAGWETDATIVTPTAGDLFRVLPTFMQRRLQERKEGLR